MFFYVFIIVFIIFDTFIFNAPHSALFTCYPSNTSVPPFQFRIVVPISMVSE